MRKIREEDDSDIQFGERKILMWLISKRNFSKIKFKSSNKEF